MNSPFKNIKFIFLAVILLPTLIFSIYEIGTFRENEKVIESIYGNQLDAILYSVNQYSEDVISGWANEFEDITHEIGIDALTDFLDQSPDVKFAYQINSDNEILFEYTSNNENYKTPTLKLLQDHKKESKLLLSYLEQGYRKLEPYKFENSDLQALLFAINVDNDIRLAIIGFDAKTFIQNTLDPKIQEITQDKFYIGAFYQNPENIIYNSDKSYQPEQFKYEKAFWLLSDYHLAIELKDQTINELVKSRSRKNLFLILIIDFVLLFGALLIYRNIKKQMELSKIKSDFISNVSHEIRTPLALISMYIETLDLGRVKTEEKKKEYYGIINQETQRLSNMVNNILNFSKIENDKREYHFGQTNINSIIKDVVNTYNYQLEKNNFDLILKLDTSVPEILADNDAITEALINLIDNAIKYSNGNRSVEIITGAQKEQVFIEVIDKGIGIAENELKRIFEKFYRVTEKNLAHKAKGSGLGLAIVQHVMTAHDGSISVKSELDKGSTFRLTFPLKQKL